MAPPFRVDTEDSVEIGARQDPAAYCGSHGERSLLPLAEDERVDTGTSRDGTTPRRHAASLHQQSDSSLVRPTPQDVDHQFASALCPVGHTVAMQGVDADCILASRRPLSGRRQPQVTVSMN